MPRTLLGKYHLWFDSCKRPPPVSDHSVFAFWVVAYGRFDCIYAWWLIFIACTIFSVFLFYKKLILKITEQGLDTRTHWRQQPCWTARYQRGFFCFIFQGCALTATGRLRRLTFSFGRLKKSSRSPGRALLLLVQCSVKRAEKFNILVLACWVRVY